LWVELLNDENHVRIILYVAPAHGLLPLDVFKKLVREANTVSCFLLFVVVHEFLHPIEPTRVTYITFVYG
jgi:hypothetical protein